MQYIYFLLRIVGIKRFLGGVEWNVFFFLYADDIFQPTDSGEGIYSKGVCVGDLQ
jgi:hypothetical protein